jgi:putative membrane protein
METVMHGNWNNDMHDGFGWGWIPMMIMMLLVFGSFIWLGVALLRRTGSHEYAAAVGPSAPQTPNPQQILAERLARGEIEPDDYRTRLEALTTTRT